MTYTNTDIHKVKISKNAEKQLRRIPLYIKEKLYEWIDKVKFIGLIEVRKIKSYHDEPLHGKREGQNSIRSSRSYRAMYIIKETALIAFAEIKELIT
jgi:proteic killer suppression protein